METVYQNRNTRGSAGFSLLEFVITLLLVGLVSSGMAAGSAFAVRQYRKSVVLSESKLLCSTLSDYVRDALRNATDISGDGLGFTFTNNDFGGENRSIYVKDPDADGYGELWIGSASNHRPFLSSSAYSTYHLKAKAEVEYQESESLFRVTLRIRDTDQSEDTVSSTFDVFRLN